VKADKSNRRLAPQFIISSDVEAVDDTHLCHEVNISSQGSNTNEVCLFYGEFDRNTEL
jgi:hypothetical protein